MDGKSIRAFLLLTFVTDLSYSEIPSESVAELYDRLLTRYNSRIRPKRDQNISTEIDVHFNPAMLVNLDTTQQKLSILTYFTFKWRDEFLVWNKSEYYGKDTVHLRVADIWHPTIKLGPSHDGINEAGNDHSKVMVDSSGVVIWMTEGLYNFVCQIDVTYYPLDTQHCEFHMYPIDECSTDVQLTFDSTTAVKQFKKHNGEWKINDVNISRNYFGHSLLLTYSIKLERRSAFTLYTSILPLLLLFILNTFVLLVPVCSGEKGSIAITFLLSFSVYISSISENLPSNSLQTPLVLILMIIMLGQSSLILLIIIEQSRAFHYESKTSLQNFLFCWILFCRRKESPAETKTADYNEQHIPHEYDVFKYIDRFMFFSAFLLNATVLGIFAFMFKL